jgi:HD-GYP domain-containing protein (c-di-GMP phosphodiesterase class II)
MARHPLHIDPDEHPSVTRTAARLRSSLFVIMGSVGLLLLLSLLAVRQAAVSARGEHARFAGVPLDGSLVALITSFIAVGVLLVLAARLPVVLAREQAYGLIGVHNELSTTTLETFSALNAAVEAKDPYAAGHGLRVTLVAILVGQELGLAESELDALRHAATFHDIGKIGVPDALLRHTGRLSDAEYALVQLHPAEGARICAQLQVLAPAVPLIRGHHERFDGTGYPDRLATDSIPLGARIIAVADAWDALTRDRPYRPGQPAFLALQEIRRCSGTQFDPVVVAAFVEALARDPWMFGLEPEDVGIDSTALPEPEIASRGARPAA